MYYFDVNIILFFFQNWKCEENKTIITIEVSGVLNIKFQDKYSVSTENFRALQGYEQHIHHV
jgi:hypothetical protein